MALFWPFWPLLLTQVVCSVLGSPQIKYLAVSQHPQHLNDLHQPSSVWYVCVWPFGLAEKWLKTCDSIHPSIFCIRFIHTWVAGVMPENIQTAATVWHKSHPMGIKFLWREILWDHSRINWVSPSWWFGRSSIRIPTKIWDILFFRVTVMCCYSTKLLAKANILK